jgi:hypothetical protein
VSEGCPLGRTLSSSFCLVGHACSLSRRAPLAPRLWPFVCQAIVPEGGLSGRLLDTRRISRASLRDGCETGSRRKSSELREWSVRRRPERPPAGTIACHTKGLHVTNGQTPEASATRKCRAPARRQAEACPTSTSHTVRHPPAAFDHRTRLPNGRGSVTVRFRRTVRSQIVQIDRRRWQSCLLTVTGGGRITPIKIIYFLLGKPQS